MNNLPLLSIINVDLSIPKYFLPYIDFSIHIFNFSQAFVKSDANKYFSLYFVFLMLMEAIDLLRKYWGHTQFRLKQEEIIKQVIDKKDTLALLPTGGGKSICYQIPALMSEGVCLVISPLIALMDDQVRFLKSKGVKSVSITSGMHYNEIDTALTNCIYGGVKFLYLSPERLQNELLQTRIKEMNLQLKKDT